MQQSMKIFHLRNVSRSWD